MLPRDEITAAVNNAEGPAIVAFITAGYPSKETFLPTLQTIAETADVVELGVPFSDPMADGVTIQRSSHEAIEAGVTLRWILESLTARDFDLAAPVLLMSYLNPLLAYGFDRLASASGPAGVKGFIVPDLPYEESAPLRAAFAEAGLALVQLVTPATPKERLATVCAASEGFVYAVTRTGITGGDSALPTDVVDYLGTVNTASDLPVCAGFGVRSADQVAMLSRHADGIIVGSALVEVLERGGNPADFLGELRRIP